MALDTNYFPGDSETNLLAKLLLLFGGSPTAGDGRPQLLRKLLAEANDASSGLEVPLNFQDSADDADAIVYHTGGTVESFRVLGSTGHIQLASSTARRIHMVADTDAVALIGGPGKSTGAFVEIYGQDHASGPGHVTVSLHHDTPHKGNFRVRSAPRDSTSSTIRFEVFGEDGECDILPRWTDSGTTYLGLKIYADASGGGYAAASRLFSAQTNVGEMCYCDPLGNLWAKKSIQLTGASASDDWFGYSANNSYQPFNNGGLSGLRAANSFYIQIDSNNDQTDRVFEVRTDAVALGGGTSLLSINESGNMTVLGNIFETVATLTQASPTALDFTGAPVRTVSLSGDITFSTANRASGRSLSIKILADGSPRNLSFPAGWKFVGGAAPASIAANKTAILSASCFGSNDSDIVAAYAVEP